MVGDITSSYWLYSDIETHNTILEFWGGSTKHPDYIATDNNYEYMNKHFGYSLDNGITPADLLQWICQQASDTTFCWTATDLIKWFMCLFFEYERISNKY